LLGTQLNAIALSPKPPGLDVQLSRSEFVIVGLVERFVFRGVSRKVNPQEFDQDFDDEGKFGNRAMDVLVHVDEVLMRREETDMPDSVRIHWPIPIEQRANIIGERRIFLLDKGHTRRLPDGNIQRMFANVIQPLNVKDKKPVRDAVKRLSLR
jgi:hypothetical protein